MSPHSRKGGLVRRRRTGAAVLLELLTEEVVQAAAEVKARVPPAGQRDAEGVLDDQPGGEREVDNRDHRRDGVVLLAVAERAQIRDAALVLAAVRVALRVRMREVGLRVEVRVRTVQRRVVARGAAREI